MAAAVVVGFKGDRGGVLSFRLGGARFRAFGVIAITLTELWVIVVVCCRYCLGERFRAFGVAATALNQAPAKGGALSF